MRSGRIYPIGVDGKTFGYTNEGFGWSSRTSTTNTLTYTVYLNEDIVRPSSGPYNRWHGFPLRCLSTVLDYVEWEMGGMLVIILWIIVHGVQK